MKVKRRKRGKGRLTGKENVKRPHDKFRLLLGENIDLIISIVMNSLIITNQDSSDKRRRGIAREHYVNYTLWMYFFVIIIIIIIISNKSRRQGDYTVEPASANGQNYSQ